MNYLKNLTGQNLTDQLGKLMPLNLFHKSLLEMRTVYVSRITFQSSSVLRLTLDVNRP